MKKILTTIAALCFIVTTSSSYATELDLSSGMISADGSVTYSLDGKIKDLSATMKHGIGGSLGAEYFFMDNTSFGIDFVGSTVFGDNGQTNRNKDLEEGIAAYASLSYYFDLAQSFYPYIGGFGGYQILSEKNTKNYFAAGANLGLLVALVDNLALDFGIKAKFNFKDNIELDLGAGWFGVKALF